MSPFKYLELLAHIGAQYSVTLHQRNGRTLKNYSSSSTGFVKLNDYVIFSFDFVYNTL